MFSTPTLHHYMESCIIIQHYAILSGIVIGKQAVFTKTQAANIIYILRKNFKQISLIYWNVFNFFADRKYLPGKSCDFLLRVFGRNSWVVIFPSSIPSSGNKKRRKLFPFFCTDCKLFCYPPFRSVFTGAIHSD